MSKILLTATGGGHLEQLKQLSPLQDDNEVLWLVDDSKVNKKTAGYFYMPAYRVETHLLKYFDMLRIFLFSYRFLRREKPDVVISTGAGTTFPVCWLQKKLFKRKVIFIESFARMTSGSKTGRAVYKFADSFIIQNENLKTEYPKAIYGGMIY